MKYYSRSFLIVIMFILLNYHSISANDESGVGRVWPAELKVWIDSEFGYEITKWTSDDYKNWHLYFNIESFIDEDNAIIYSDRTGTVNFFKLNMIKGTIIQLTDHDTDIGGKVWHYPEMNKLWYEVSNTIRVLNYESMENKEIRKFDDAKLRSFTVTCDEKFLVYSINKNPGWNENNSTGPYAIFRYDLNTKETEQISPDYGFKINHLQASPTNPRIIIYSWQHQYRKGAPGIVGNVPIRIWWLNVDGKDGGPVDPQEYGIHRTHEFWLHDGTRIGYSARYKYGENDGRQFLGSCKPDGSDNFMFEVPVGPAHSQIYKDNHHWVADQNDGMILTMWTFDRENILNEEKLFRHESSWNGQPSHPHPHFSPDGKIILFSTDKSGIPAVYSVKVGINDEE
jgi:oligogalacturonide lyase